LKLSRELGKHNGEAPQQKEEAHFKIKVLKTENYETGIMAATLRSHKTDASITRRGFCEF